MRIGKSAPRLDNDPGDGPLEDRLQNSKNPDLTGVNAKKFRKAVSSYQQKIQKKKHPNATDRRIFRAAVEVNIINEKGRYQIPIIPSAPKIPVPQTPEGRLKANLKPENLGKLKSWATTLLDRQATGISKKNKKPLAEQLCVVCINHPEWVRDENIDQIKNEWGKKIPAKNEWLDTETETAFIQKFLSELKTNIL